MRKGTAYGVLGCLAGVGVLYGALLPTSCLLSAAPASPPNARVLINGAGATFPYPIYSKWFDEYHKAHPDVEINYQSIGSGGGIRQLQSGTVDFGASDMPLSNDQLGQFKVKVLHHLSARDASGWSKPSVRSR